MIADSTLVSQLQVRWLDYAVKLLNDLEHRGACERNNGALRMPISKP